MTEKLGGLVYNPDVFYLLSGGSLGGAQSVDIDQARIAQKRADAVRVRRRCGQQILTGKIKVGPMYPLVAECQRILPAHLRRDDAPSWQQWTFEKSFTRMDDAKNENLRKYLVEPAGALPDAEQQLLTGEAPVSEKKTKKKEDPPQQMRYTVEMLAAGSVLYQRIDLCDMTDLELGAFVSALVEFSKRPYIGGKSNVGCGLCEIEYTWRLAGAKETVGKFLSVDTDCPLLPNPLRIRRMRMTTSWSDIRTVPGRPRGRIAALVGGRWEIKRPLVAVFSLL